MKDRPDSIIRPEQATYLASLLPQRDELLVEMEHYAAERGHPIADPEVALMMRILVRTRDPKRLLEVGTNIGYSVVTAGRECAEDAVFETIEIDAKTLDVARGYVGRAALPCDVVFHQGAALEVLPGLAGPFDFVFIDCVKQEYGDYLDALIPKLAEGAVIVCDNLLWKGDVARGVDEANANALRDFNRKFTTHPQLTSLVLPLGDGTGVALWSAAL
ncbi:MAG TPA: O-methyltransferase [Thermoanaerobaculia bacterium]